MSAQRRSISSVKCKIQSFSASSATGTVDLHPGALHEFGIASEFLLNRFLHLNHTKSRGSLPGTANQPLTVALSLGMASWILCRTGARVDTSESKGMLDWRGENRESGSRYLLKAVVR
jgi:hypothetical protein